jgi:ketosteroid isomerase-like protein
MAYEALVTSDRVDETFASEFVARGFQALSSHDLDGFLAQYTEDVVFEDPFASGGKVQGHAELQKLVLSQWRAAPDLTFEPLDSVYLSVDGTKVAVPWRAKGTATGRLDPPGFAPTGGSIELVGVDLMEFRDGEVCHVRSIGDTMTLARQIGAAPSPGTLGERLVVLMQRVSARRMRRRANR